MSAASSLVVILFSLMMMALAFLVLYFVVKVAVKHGVLAALDDGKSTQGVHRIITLLRGGGPLPQSGQQQFTPQPQQQYAPQQPQYPPQQPQYPPQEQQPPA